MATKNAAKKSAGTPTKKAAKKALKTPEVSKEVTKGKSNGGE